MKYENNLLIIQDIHTKYEKVERIISKFSKTHKFIFMGDYFDNFNDTPDINEDTASFLKRYLDKEWVFLYGNHDVIYHPNYTCMCSGFTTSKKIAINRVMEISDWNKLKYFHFENNHLFSHAGITKFWFQNPTQDKFDINTIQKTIDDAVIKMESGNFDNAIWSASKRRGGRNDHGGIIWEDWRDLNMIPNLNQVVGHTPIKKIATIQDNNTNCSITNVDNSASSVYFTQILEIDRNGNKNIIDTSYI
jgi:hypothetical protein